MSFPSVTPTCFSVIYTDKTNNVDYHFHLFMVLRKQTI